VITKSKILFVQNAQTQGNNIKRHLEVAGYAVVWAGSGVAALAAAKRESVDLILIDVALPDIEGSDLCRRFRAREATQAVPIILLAGNGYTPVRSDGNNGGPDDFLVKPYSEGELDARIAVTLRKRTVIKQPEALAAPALSPRPVTTGGQIAQPTSEWNVVSQQEPRPAPAAEPKPTELQQEPVTTVRQIQQPTPERTVVSQQEPRPVPAAEPKPAGLQQEPVTTVRQIQQQMPERTVVPQQELVTTEGQLKQPTPERTDGSQQEPRLAPAAEPKSAGLEQVERNTDQQSGQTTASKPRDAVMGDEIVDHETGLFSRRQFDTMFSKEFKRVVRFKQQMSCMMINLEGGKLGRQADKSMLKAIIQLVQHTIREVDTAAWWSGEAFVILLPNTMKNDAVQAAARILDAVAIHPFTWADSTKVTMSIGVAGLPDRKIDTEQKLIEAAAAACRRAGEFMTP
jgi:two-component system, cell cycle response regulator